MPQGTFAEFVKTPKSPASTQTFADFVQSVRPKKQTGLLEPGNIDLFAQPTVKNPKGGMSTVFSSSYNVDGREVLLPAVTPDGRFLSTDDDVLGEYRRTGRHLGIFSDGDSATTYAKQLHEDYEAGKYTRKATPPPSRALLPNAPQDRVSDALVEQPKDLVSTLSKATGISAPPQAKPATFLGRLSDLGISSLEGAISVPETAVGFVDIPTGGRVGKALETVGFKPKAARDILETYYTEQQQFANRRVAEAEGLVDTAIAALKNPSTIVHTVVQSAPLMLGAGGIARTLVSRGVSAITAAAIGEGAVSAGQTAETIREASPSGTLMPKQATVAAVSGAVTGGLGAFGGKLAQRLGIADVDTLLAAGVKDATARTSLVKGVVYGAVQEGFVEELPQSVQEQIAQNIATEKPWDQGVSQAAVLGALAGAVMGGGAQATSAAFTPKTVQAPAPSEPQTFADFAAQPRPAPTSPATPASPAPVVAAPPSTQAERNAQTRAEAAVAGSASRDPVAVESGRALERRVQEGISPTGEERRAPETALVPSTLSKLTSDQLMTTLTEAQNRGLIQTWTATDQDEQGELLEVGILKNNGEWMHVGRASASLPSTGSTEVTDISPPKAERDEHSFSSTQVDLPAEHAAAVVQMAKAIPDEDIAEDGRAGDSEGSAPHVTVKYGIHSTDVEDVRKVLANEPPITVTLGATSFFPNSESGSGDVLKIDVDSPDLHRVNAKIAEALEVTDTHPTYVPHVTVAYLQPGKGQEYAGDESLKGQTMTLGALRFSTKDGIKTNPVRRVMLSANPQRIDTGTSQAQTVPSEAEPDEGEGVGAPRGATFDRVAPSVPTRLEGQRQREDRRTAHYRDVWNVVLTRAQAVDPAVTRTQLRKEFDARIALVDDLDTEFRESGHNLRTLLDAIATHGGISLEAEHLGGYAGELRWLRERKEPYGNFASVPNVFRVRSQDAVTGRPRTGVSLDDMVRILSGDPRFAYIQDIPDLFAALEDAARQGDVGMRGAIYPGTDELAKRAGMRPGEKWWEESWRESEQATEPEPLTAESYQRAFGGTKEQAEAIVQAYEAMGIPLERVLVAKGGGPAVEDAEREVFYQDDYHGDHRPPSHDEGAPLHDLTGGGRVYPDDVYGPNAARYYGHGGDQWALDQRTAAIVMRLRGQPNARVTIYRAIPDDVTAADKIAKLEKQKAYILKHGKLPPNIETTLPRSAYYDRVSEELTRLKALPEDTAAPKVEINPGDWVTINREYAKSHGEHALNGEYRIISKSVRAKDVFTNGDSIHEWGYWPEGSFKASPKVVFQGPKASVEFTEHGNAIIRALENPNVSSGLHETWHVARRFFFDRSIPQELREGITDDDILMAEDAFGATDGVWDHAAEEKWARAGERYFYNGDAPTARLKALFEKFARWLARIYQRIAGSPIDIEISPAMKQVFDRLVMRSGRLEEATSFDVDALEQELATLRGEDVLYQRDRSLPSTVGKEDRLATGEVQPRLPGAEAVREQEIATPTFEAPFTLTAQPSKVTKGKQDTLFQGAGKPPTDASRITPEQIAAVARRRKLTIDQVRKAAEQAGYTVVEPPRASWDAPEPSKLDTVIYTLQDRHIDTKRVLKAIADTALLIEDERDVYLQEELFHGRVAVKTETFLTDELKPLLREMAAKGVTVHGFDEYLHARHAEEANDAIAERNPEMPDGGSGMTTQEAKDYLATVPSEQRQAFEALAARVDQIVAGTRQMLVDYDLEAQETVDAWADAYQYYVPLQREDMGGGPGIGQGYSVRGPASKRRTGSHRTVVDILANLALQRERNIVRGEKNRVSTALYGLAKANPNPAFWTIAKPGITTSISAETGEPVDVVDLSYQGLDTVVMSRARREDGSIIQRGVAFNERDPRAQRMALALKNLDVDDLGEILSVSAKATRYFASINTQYNPVFGVVNLIRDAQEALLNLSSTAIAGKQAAVLSHIPSALSGIYADLRAERGGRHKGSAWAAEFEEFQREGGQTGYRDLYRTSSDRAKALEREIRAVGSGRAKRFGRAVFDWLSDYNLAMENATRLAAYHVAKENGLSRQRAASLAKNLTVNFNRKGQITREAGALYAFFNASAQGTARVVETLKGPAGAKIIAGGIAVGVLQALALAAAGFDDEEPPQFLRERSLIFPIGGKRYLTLPMPLGFYILPNLGRVATEFALAHGTKPATRVLALMNVAMDSFNPIGNAGLSVQTIAPTVVDPIVALAENKDWTGQPIAREDVNALQPTPGYTRAKDTATTVGIMISKGLNALSGGTDYTPGLLSPTPDQIDYLIAQATGGIGREAAKLEQTVSSVRSGEELPPYKVPLMGRFYGTTTGQASEARRFYDHLRELNRHELELRGRRAARQTTAPYLADHPDARLVGAANAVERRVSDMRKRKRTLVEKQAPATAVRAIEQRITATMRQFNAQVEAQMR